MWPRRLVGALVRWSAAVQAWLESWRPSGPRPGAPGQVPSPPQAPPHRHKPIPAPSGEGAVTIAAVVPAPGLPALTPVRSVPSVYWERIELYHDQRPLFSQEPFIPKIYHRDPEILAAFGSATPHSGAWLLHYGRKWEINLAAARADGRKVVPVLLIPGAGLTANRPFGKGPIAPILEAAGHVVFAISFAHPHGDNWQQAEALADAIARVCAITGANQVDLVAHSKGAVAARLYTSNLHLSGGTAYRGDVRRLVLLGAPNNGIDLAFRHPLLFWCYSWFGSAPSPYIPPLRSSIYPGGAFPGQAQMVRELRDIVPLRDPDRWNTQRLYEGGMTLYGYSRGARWTAEAGGYLIDRLNAAGVDPGVEIAVLAGTNPHLVVDGIPIVGETDGESDGVVLTCSALYTEGLVRRGARLRTVERLPLSHVDLVADPRAAEWTLAELY